MDKNISTIDLSELMKAREDLNKELGVETDPNMYKNYNPNREKESQSMENNYENIIKTDEKSDVNLNNNLNSQSDGISEKNLTKLDAFSAFEVKSSGNDNTTSNTIKEDLEPKIENNIEQALDNNINKIENVNELESLLDGLLDDLDDEIDELEKKNNSVDEEAKLESKSENTDDLDIVRPDIDIEANFNDETENNDNESLVDDENQEKEVNNNSVDFGLSIDDLKNMQDDEESEKTEESTEENLFDETDENTSQNEENELTENTEGFAGNEEAKPVTEGFATITDFNTLQEILQNELRETEIAEEEKIDEITEGTNEQTSMFKEIEDFKFVNEITTDAFNSSDKFSYIMGKNEDNKIVFGNFKEHFNLAVFGKNQEVINSFLNSMILSLCLKNDNNEVNFAILDSDINSSFEIYNKSSFMYFNRIAKTNKEILDTLIEISKEVDSRYEKLANLGLKSIEQYNDFAISSETRPMPYLIVVFNNYTDASHTTDNDKINTCLYQILKYGKLAGVYVVLTARLLIEESQVNYSLSSRLSFKSDVDSRYTVGSVGGNDLPEDSDALYYNIATGKVEHVKSATITDMEVDLIINNLED